MFNKICIIGVGLMGGSIARAARQYGLSQTIVGFGRDDDLTNLQTAQNLGVIDEHYTDIARALANADCIVLATPVGAIESVFASLKPFWDEKAIYTDVGSTKGSVISAAERIFGSVPDNLVPAHPIAGAEQSGVVASLDDMFVNKRVIITPTNATRPDGVQIMRMFWERLGAQVAIMDAAHHDAILAATSHLPHIVAFALVDMLGHKDEQSEIFKYAAGGFRDFTRIASSDPTMWRDICVANKNEIIPLIQQLKIELGKIESLLDSNDNQQLFNTFTYAGKARQRFLDLFEN
ncbi:protein TyrC [Methyloglobulus morosus KoM1]|uniref:prephenate dehydrogenase n=1 Tax=Methyloglobulus morosus KoM1 TaxID=1116472 RepID=V5C919_9GAMM|nr:prephenate dehydrogenase/arogenate dehydrogenase family protein [Methyloglobulus morosus]ESS73248.1 protein TyrC [Methyloglobulus morosus KoM1]